DQLREARRRGYAEQLEESSIGVASVAAPIRDDSGRVVAAISMARPVAGLSPTVRRRHAAATLEAAGQISERLGFRLPAAVAAGSVRPAPRTRTRPGRPRPAPPLAHRPPRRWRSA